MADSAVIAGATAVDIDHLNATGEVVLAVDGSDITVILEKGLDFSLLGPL